MPREDEEDYRWARTGWISQDRPCDISAQRAFNEIKAPVLPPRWKKNPYTVAWSRTASYHLLWIHDLPILRIWTNTKKDVTIEISDLLANVPIIKAMYKVKDIPAGTLKKRPEFKKRITLLTSALLEMQFICNIVRNRYGLES